MTHIVEPPARRVSSSRLGATTAPVLLPPPWGGVSFVGAEPPPPLAGAEWRASVANRVELAVNINEDGSGPYDISMHCTVPCCYEQSCTCTCARKRTCTYAHAKDIVAHVQS